MTIIYKTIIFSFLLIFSSNTYAHSVEWSFGDLIYIFGISLVLFFIVIFVLVRAMIKANNELQESKTKAESKNPNNITEPK